MRPRNRLCWLKLVATAGVCVVAWGCGDDADTAVSDASIQQEGGAIVQPPAAFEGGAPAIPNTPGDAGSALRDAGGDSASARSDGGAALIDASMAMPDADGGSVSAPDAHTNDDGALKDASAPDADEDPCTLMAYQGDGDEDVPLLEVNGGVTIRGVGCKQQWEGIVKVVGGRGLCTAAFISERHLISASHCYARAGAVSVQVSAPTWDNGMNHTFQAQVKLSGSNQSLDVSVIDLGQAVAWATPERRFVLHAGKASTVDMHLYGFGSGGSSGAAGTLRGVPNRATIRVTDNGRGNLTGKAGAAQLCTGDSGGPAFVEKTTPVLYGINQAIVPAGTGGGRTCAGPDWTIMFTNVSAYLSFIEGALGKPCARKQVDGLDVAQCW